MRLCFIGLHTGTWKTIRTGLVEGTNRITGRTSIIGVAHEQKRQCEHCKKKQHRVTKFYN